jgi:predicted dehydrogenase
MSEAELKLGVVGLDGHGPVFISLLHGPDCPVPGLRVTAAMPVPSAMISERQLAENTEAVAKFGVRIAADAAELASGVDGILILHNDGSKHYELAKLLADKGRPLFIDKPLEADTSAAAELLELCRRHGCPVFSASCLRFSAEIEAAARAEEGEAILSAMAYSPYIESPTMPGWIYYGIHAVEPLYRLMGTGCREVRCTMYQQGPVAVGIWEDGRTGIARAIRGGEHGYGFIAWKERATVTAALSVDTVGTHVYLELLKRIKLFFQTGTAPVSPEESLEVIAFMEAANKSMAQEGRGVQLCW